MANGRSIIQIQWSLDNTVFKTAESLLDLLIASSSLCLLVEIFELTVNGKLAVGVTGGKVGMQTCCIAASSVNGNWTMQEWQEGKVLSSIIVQCEENYSTATSTLDFFPATGARSVLATQYDLEEDETEEVGIIAEALVVASIKTAVIKSDLDYGMEPQSVPFKNHMSAGLSFPGVNLIKLYRWNCDKTFVQKAQDLSEDIVEWIKKSCPNVGQVRQQKGHPLFQEPLSQLGWVMTMIEDWRRTRPGSFK